MFVRVNNDLATVLEFLGAVGATPSPSLPASARQRMRAQYWLVKGSETLPPMNTADLSPRVSISAEQNPPH